jgi:hypothetical protein
MPISGLSSVNNNDYNDIQVILDDILGLGENGYGMPQLRSSPLSTGARATANQWNALIGDLNTVRYHITNAGTSTAYFITGTTVVNSATINNLYADAYLLQNSAQRYTCHPSQFYTTSSNRTIFSKNSLSLRTKYWGTDTNSISHQVVATFPNPLTARYYFNLGSYLNFVPYVQGAAINDLDGEWLNFVNYLRASGNEYRYTHGEFVNYLSTTTTINSGTLQVKILAEKAIDETSVKFTITYKNNASSTVQLVPSASIYNITV